MPSPLIHAQVAYEFKNRCLDDLTPAFLLGIIAPDAIHMRDGNTWSDKAITHFYELADLSFERALLQAVQELNHLDQDFVRGYLVHLYTDYLWREQIYTPFFLERKDKIARCDLHDCYYRDMVRLDHLVIHPAMWLDEVRTCLQVATPPSVSTL
ncbi:MAG: zinc dependent phospholipase C family protein, partial [Turicibacter sp.]